MGITSPGCLISLEGGERSGKSTQVQRLTAHLRRRGWPVALTREPGGTPLGERLREVLLDPGLGEIDPVAEMILFAASRAEVVARVIRPALDRGEVVVCDRYVDSSRAYQGFGLGVDLAAIDAVNEAGTAGLRPDLTLLFDVAPAVAATRAGTAGPDRIERRPPGFHERVRQGYLELARRDPERFVVLDAHLAPEALTRRVVAVVDHLLAARRACGPGTRTGERGPRGESP